MIVLAGGDLVLPDRILTRASLALDGGRIVAIEPKPHIDPPGARVVECRDCYVVPGFVDVHVHGVEGHDTQDLGAPVAEIAARLPRYGVTAFCPTTVACAPSGLRGVLDQVTRLRAERRPNSARVLPAHLESNFVNPEYRGAQPGECLRFPRDRRAAREGPAEGDFSAGDILDVITRSRAEVGIVTMAPELPGGIDLVRSLVAAGHIVSIGHSGANVDEAMAAIDAGARQATHLFNRMTPMTHRAPGIAGAVLARDEVAAELICDGYHVHPAMCRVALAAKGAGRIMAITDGTAGSGLPVGSSARLGGRHIRITKDAAMLDDGTLAGSTLTMDRAFRMLVTTLGLSVVEAATLCSTTPARELGLKESGELATGWIGDVVVLDRDFQVIRTFIEGQQVNPVA
jgi:N-acetylglucosamine-6-phosphate deacetylase